MTMWKTLAAALLATAALTAGAAAKAPDKLVLDANSQNAVLVIKADWWQPAPSMKSAFKLALSGYDPVEQKLLGAPFGGALFEAKQKNFADGYLAITVKPGRWVFASYQQQDKWALCFNAGTLQFDVRPGEVVYLGALDTQAHRRELTEQAIRSGKIRLSGYGFADFFDLPEGPHLGPVDDAGLAAVRTMLAHAAPGVNAPVRAAVYSPARFGTGSTLFAERRCGGYFSKGARGN